MITLTPSIIIFYKYWIIFIATLFLVAPTDISIENKITGLLYLFLFYSVIFFKKPSKHLINISINEKKINNKFIIILIFLQFLLSNNASLYYTGSDLITAIQAIIRNTNQYIEYQTYFRENFDSSYSFNRILAILSLAYVKSFTLFLLAAFFTQRLKRHSYILILLTITPLILFGLARGTFFEIFEILMIFVYFSLTSGYYNRIKKIPRMFIKLATPFILILFVSLFFLNTLRRYESTSSYFEHTCSHLNYCFKDYGIFYPIEYVFYILANYFSIGLYFLSEFFLIIISGDLLNTVFPMYYRFSGEADGLRDMLCTNYVDCRAVWMPDIILIIDIFGITSLFLIFIIFTKITKIEEKILDAYNLFSLPLLYTIFIFLISLPVGNFYTVSSSNILSSMIFLILWYLKYRGIRKITTKHSTNIINR